MDPFAQSRADDDLFADDFEPVAEPTETVETSQPAIVAEPVVSSTQAEVPNPTIKPTPKQQERKPNQRQRGGRGGSNQNGMGQSRFAPQAESNVASPQISKPPPQVKTSNSEVAPEVAPEVPSQATPNPAPISELPTKTLAVRGDRSATGGPAHKKLTEEELNAKMEKMAIINAQKSERHRLSEADQAAFQHREKELAKERREKAVAEKKNERIMEMERAKNRERKMKAQGGREWDSEKTEADIVDRRGRSSEFVRGSHGGVIRGGSGLAGSRFATGGDEQDDSRPTRGGGFEIRGRGRGRGGRGGGRGGKETQAVPTPDEFPPLSAAPVVSPNPGGDWAEEMATPVEEKKMDIGRPEDTKA